VRRVLLALSVLALSACGGGGDDRLSAAEYRTKADAICRAANQKLENLRSPSTPDELRALMKKAKPTLQQGIDDLEELKPPEELESRVDEWNRKNKELLAKFEELSKETRLVQLGVKAQERESLNDETNRYARAELGLDECGSG
jgi:Tfp pilus assembly protein PilP